MLKGGILWRLNYISNKTKGQASERQGRPIQGITVPSLRALGSSNCYMDHSLVVAKGLV